MKYPSSPYCLDQDFALWAFGEDTWTNFVIYEACILDLMHQWNLLHSDLMKLDGDEPIINSMAKMKDHYNKRDK